MPADIIHIHSNLYTHKTNTMFGKCSCGVGAYVPRAQIYSPNGKFNIQFQQILNASLINQSRINKSRHKFSLFF